MPGQISVAHKKRYVDDYRAHAEIMRERASAIRTSLHGRRRDRRAARLDALFRRHARHRHRPHPSAEAHCRHGARGGRCRGATLFENTRATDIATRGGKVRVTTPLRHDHRRQRPDRRQRLWRRPRAGERRARHADRLVHRRDGAARRRQPGAAGRRSGRRFALRRSAISASRSDGRLLFGGREIYAVKDPRDIHIHIRRQIAEIYPALKDVEITHGWGGLSASPCRASRSCARSCPT